MKRFADYSLLSLLAALVCITASAQTPTQDKSDTALLDALTKKIDLQNAKIDALSQQILKLEQHVSAIRPGVMIGETPAPVTTEAPKPPQTGNSHVVAKGETLTSIAKMHHVSVEEYRDSTTSRRSKIADRPDDHDPDVNDRLVAGANG